jgi:eukaryotic-like serine/threonine-protein kinase
MVMPGPRRYLAELTRRRVIPVTVAYAAVAFAAVEAADIYFPLLGLPEWAFRVFAVAALLGLPVTVALAWMFDLTRSGVTRTPALPEGADTLAPSPATSPGARRRRLAAATTVIVLALAAGAYVVTRSYGPTAGPAADAPLRYSVRQLTAEPGVEWFPSLSPDGAWVVYGGLGPEGRDIFLRSVGGQNPINLTADTPEDDDQPAFSPDGDRIAFRSERDGGGIFVMARTGEGVRRLTRFGYRPTWSPDGRALAFATENVELNPQNAEASSELWVLDVASGALRQLESVSDAVFPSWSPGGARIAYFDRRLGEPELAGIWTVGLDDGPEVYATGGASRDWGPVWSPDGRYLFFASDRAGSMNLWRLPIDEATGTVSGDAEPVTTPATSLAHISVSADGRRVVYTSVLVTINVQRMAVDPATARPVGEPEWVTTGTRRWSSPDPSPDGRRIAMYSLTQPEGEIYLINSDGTGLRQVTGDSAVDRVPRWSPDGEWLTFFSTRGGPVQVWRVRPDGSDLGALTDEGTVPVWAPDGTRMATRTRAGYIHVFDPRRPWGDQVPDTVRLAGPGGLGFAPNDWSSDGEWLAGTDGFADTGILNYEVATGRHQQLTDFGQWPVWLSDNRTLLFVSGGNAFYTVDRTTGEVRRVFGVDRDILGPPRLSRDGRAIYFTRRVTEADLWMVTFES